MVALTNRFYTDSFDNECLTNLSLTVFTQRNFVADFLHAKCDFTPKTAVLRFEPHPLPPFGGGEHLRITYDDYFRPIGKRVVDFSTFY